MSLEPRSRVLASSTADYSPPHGYVHPWLRGLIEHGKRARDLRVYDLPVDSDRRFDNDRPGHMRCLRNFGVYRRDVAVLVAA